MGLELCRQTEKELLLYDILNQMQFAVPQWQFYKILQLISKNLWWFKLIIRLILCAVFKTGLHVFFFPNIELRLKL